MFDTQIIKHHIDRHILQVLMYTEVARFRDMRPPRTDTNLYSYHLTTMLRDGWITKVDGGYSLSRRGLMYVDRVNAEKVRVSTQPKIITMLVAQNSEGQVLLQRRFKQPYIGTWTLPYGKLHIDDASVLAAAEREAIEKLDHKPTQLRHVGDAYIRVYRDVAVLTVTLAHVVRFETDSIEPSDNLLWIEPLKLAKLTLAPAVEQIVTRSFFGDDFYFEEFNVKA